jgi:hypothetical protein
MPVAKRGRAIPIEHALRGGLDASDRKQERIGVTPGELDLTLALGVLDDGRNSRHGLLLWLCLDACAAWLAQ